jgi:hypothetical protein
MGCLTISQNKSLQLNILSRDAAILLERQEIGGRLLSKTLRPRLPSQALFNFKISIGSILRARTIFMLIKLLALLGGLKRTNMVSLVTSSE